MPLAQSTEVPMPRLPIALSAALILSSAALAHDPGPGPVLHTIQAPLHDPLNCYCRAQGKVFAVGETACLRTGEGPRVAECGMVLNNTSWQFTGRACPQS
jgi:hypothetical protein